MRRRLEEIQDTSCRVSVGDDCWAYVVIRSARKNGTVDIFVELELNGKRVVCAESWEELIAHPRSIECSIEGKTILLDDKALLRLESIGWQLLIKYGECPTVWQRAPYSSVISEEDCLSFVNASS